MELVHVDADICSLDCELSAVRKRCGRERRASKRVFNLGLLERLRCRRDELSDHRSELRTQLRKLISERERLNRPLWCDILVEH